MTRHLLDDLIIVCSPRHWRPCQCRLLAAPSPRLETGDFSGWTRPAFSSTGLANNTGFTSVTSFSFYVNSGTFGASLGPVADGSGHGPAPHRDTEQRPA